MSPSDSQADLGTGLLASDFGRERESKVSMMMGAYRAILDGRLQNLALWHAARTDLITHLQAEYARNGLIAPPWFERSLWARISLPGPAIDQIGHLRLIEALLTDFREPFCAHIRYRMANHGNVHLSLSGPTGMAKSSCAIALADWIRPIQAEKLHEHLSFDLGDLPRRLKGKQPRETVIQDEFVQMAGEGARTAQSLFANLEDTLRASQINLFVVSPQSHEHRTMQAELELVMWNPARQYSLFIVWLQGVPHGVVALPWARRELWDAYAPWKQANVERTVAGRFKDAGHIARTAIRAFEDKRFVSFLLTSPNKPKASDFESAFEFFLSEMLSAQQLERMARFAQVACYGFERMAPRFPDWFGVEANEGMRLVAERCYKE